MRHPARVIPRLTLMLATLATVAVVIVPAQTPPATPATEQLRRWLDVFNAADDAQWRQFVDQFASPRLGPFVDQNVAFRNQTGGLDLVRIESATATRAVAVVKERDAEGIGATLIVDVDAANPHRIVDVQIQPGVR